MTGTSAVEETAVITSRTATPESQNPSDQQTGELLHILGLADQTRTSSPSPPHPHSGAKLQDEPLARSTTEATASGRLSLWTT